MKIINSSVGTGSHDPFKMSTHPELPTLYFDQVEGQMDNQNGTIYIATNLINRKQYVGQTIRTLKERINCHKSSLSYCFGNAIKKYGIQNFKWVPIEYPIEELDKMECFWIQTLNTIRPNGYNLQYGGQKSHSYSEELKRKMRENHTDYSGKNHPRFGLHWDEEHKQNQSKKLKGRFIGEKNPNFGNKWTQEQKDALSKKKKEMHQNKIQRINNIEE
jgi:group I intron endonuclease